VIDRKSRPAVLCVCDGWGSRDETRGNAIALASTPNYDRLLASAAHTQLAASGLAVGLPEGQQGNSEVGHLTIGSGRVVLQDLTRIAAAIADGSFYTNAVLESAVELAQERGSRLHLLGLVSPGGVHSDQSQLVALCELCRRKRFDRVFVHAFTDGRDTAPTSGREDLADLQTALREIGVGKLASVGGRYFAMDRDHRWDRTQLEFDTVLGRAPVRVTDALAYLAEQYREGTTDEFIPPAAVVGPEGSAIGMGTGDVLIHFNFRPDRARQLCHALIDEDFHDFDRGRMPGDLRLFTFTRFDDSLNADVAFPKPLVQNTLAEVVSKSGLRQFHVAETEKYAHVTYFLNGGREEPFPGEERLLVPSPQVSTYDQAPAMSAEKVADAAVEQIERAAFALIVVNFANADMVGHTGDLAATIQAVECLDPCLGRLARAADAAEYIFLMTADHGNAESKIDSRDGSPLTAHTTSSVPMILSNVSSATRLALGGGLQDVAPTLLATMGLPIPAEMTGSDLRRGGGG
jgi:2,3-bisphosphoglycerate-independent phosphoglycerate mutase